MNPDIASAVGHRVFALIVRCSLRRRQLVGRVAALRSAGAGRAGLVILIVIEIPLVVIFVGPLAATAGGSFLVLLVQVQVEREVLFLSATAPAPTGAALTSSAASLVLVVLQFSERPPAARLAAVLVWRLRLRLVHRKHITLRAGGLHVVLQQAPDLLLQLLQQELLFVRLRLLPWQHLTLQRLQQPLQLRELCFQVLVLGELPFKLEFHPCSFHIFQVLARRFLGLQPQVFLLQHAVPPLCQLSVIMIRFLQRGLFSLLSLPLRLQLRDLFQRERCVRWVGAALEDVRHSLRPQLISQLV
mmetsp:Transcript_19994/g.50399  ORF Transcript_19994/g.50399 Transcript_19994/m.50399 type:complete len:301 (+) Transcript_19994:537-1439(+)